MSRAKFVPPIGKFKFSSLLKECSRDPKSLKWVTKLLWTNIAREDKILDANNLVINLANNVSSLANTGQITTTEGADTAEAMVVADVFNTVDIEKGIYESVQVSILSSYDVEHLILNFSNTVNLFDFNRRSRSF